MNIYTPNEAVNQGKPCALSQFHSTLLFIWNNRRKGLYKWFI